MVETISPVVYGGRRRRYLLAISIHTLAAGASAAAVGVVLGGTGALLGGPWDEVGPWAIGAVAALYALGELVLLPVPLPNRKAQVPAWWRSFFHPYVAAGLYGFGLGPGFLTYLGFGTYAAVLTGALVSGDPIIGALITSPFGVARGLAVLTGGRASDEDEPAVIVGRLVRFGAQRSVAVAHGLLLAGIATVALL